MIRMMMYAQTKGGDARFQAMMKDFIQSHFNKQVSTEDFKAIVEKHMTPEMNVDNNGKMDWFFNEWVYGTQVPAYKLEYKKNGGNHEAAMQYAYTKAHDTMGDYSSWNAAPVFNTTIGRPLLQFKKFPQKTYALLGNIMGGVIKGDRARYWFGVGAQPSDTVVRLLKQMSVLDEGGKVIPEAAAAPAS